MYDLIIIGAGTAGISAYNEAIKYTQNILIINDGSWDTTCARVGCMPSKLLISSANRMHDIQTAEELALKHNAVIDTSDVMQRVHVLRERFIRATLKGVDQWDSSHKISGKAKFIDPQTIEVNGQSYRAKSFIVAVGSRPNIDETLKQQLKEKYITSNEIFEFSQLPKSLAVIGSGIIAIELAQAMQRLGVQTTMFARSQKVGALTSPILQKLAQEQLSKELNIKFKTLPDEIEIQADKIIKINFTENDQTKSIEVEYVLGATGRQSNIDRLGLDQLNSTFKDIKNLPIDKETKQLANLPIFIVGDAAPDAPIQHEAALTGKQVVHNCLNYPEVKPISALIPLAIVFCHPEMAIVGKSFKHLEDQQIEFIRGFVSYENQGRALVLAEDSGGIEVYIAKKSGKLLGAELFCSQAEHLAHLLAWMIDADQDIYQILKKPFYHPTLEEGLRTAFKHARRQFDSLS
ncbi:dihydrolipoyl dehydrogenase [Acinetobacter lwoffii]|uniref:dihydrolipoyl dehydrogenase n=1 Tax=Acinetobacter lwoffii TaxID=28090 RepID=UPI002097D2C5|nr:dihydrolipoyl dehydrogenase [Acinetobacter lwoffii]MCO8082900.1 dihydrolipoyl dehydrogenase [Acinetobacter lwoffii]